jgi:hypothetical protein
MTNTREGRRVRTPNNPLQTPSFKHTYLDTPAKPKTKRRAFAGRS